MTVPDQPSVRVGVYELVGGRRECQKIINCNYDYNNGVFR